jgi:predicted lipoprotein with Yx(FWY)xxD motif
MAVAVGSGMLLLGGCGGTGGGDRAAGTSDAAALGTAGSDLGTVVVDGRGRTVYVFDEDVKGSGASACSEDCLVTWPAVPADSGIPEVDEVTGAVSTIPRDDGTAQVTLDGRPLYTFAGDAGPGDVTGQGVGGVWWVVSPDGTAITAAPSVPEPPSY